MSTGKHVATLEGQGPEDQVYALIEYKQGIMLDIGCGDNKQPRFIGMDMRPRPGVDIIWDVEEYPWPLPDDCVITAICNQLIEHLNPCMRKMPDGSKKAGFIAFMDEVWRIMKPDGQLTLTTPYAGSAGFWQDPTHIAGFTEGTFAYFDPLELKYGGQELYRIYKPLPWRLEFLSAPPTGNLEVVMSKRRWDPTFGCPDPKGIKRPYSE